MLPPQLVVWLMLNLCDELGEGLVFPHGVWPGGIFSHVAGLTLVCLGFYFVKGKTGIVQNKSRGVTNPEEMCLRHCWTSPIPCG